MKRIYALALSAVMVLSLTACASAKATNDAADLDIGSFCEYGGMDIEDAAGGENFEVCEANIVTGEMHEHNTFDAPETVMEKSFEGYRKEGNGVRVSLPACSVVELRLKK